MTDLAKASLEDKYTLDSGRVFIEFLAASFGPEPYWDRAAARGAKPRIKGRPADQTP